jgi:hypothetical protein
MQQHHNHTRQSVWHSRIVVVLLVLAFLTACNPTTSTPPPHSDTAEQATMTNRPTLQTARGADAHVPNPPTPTPQAPVVHDIQAPIDWYVWQGYWNDGELEPGAKFNCGPATVAMALRYGSNNALQLTPEEVRDTIPNKRDKQEGMLHTDLVVALDYWEMPWRKVTSMEEIEQAIARNHIVVASVRMSKIRRADESTPLQACASNGQCVDISGRYSNYEGQHAVVVKGLVEDSTTGQRYVVVYDPDVWGSNANYYYLGDGRFPKGLNRLYPYEEFRDALYAQRPKALEILATPWEPMEYIDPQSGVVIAAGKSVVSSPFWCPSQAGDVSNAVWCGW